MTVKVGTTGGQTDRRAGGRAAPPPLDLDRVRADFPIFERPVRGRRLAYLDSAATAQKPRAVIDAVSGFYQRENANVHRGVYALSELATEGYDRAREAARRFLNAARPEEIVFTSGTTASLNLIAHAWGGAYLRAGDEIILTTYEHHSNLIPWQIAAVRSGAALRVVSLPPDGGFDLDGFDRLLSDRTRLVAVSHVSNVLGTVTPVAELVERTRRAAPEALVVVDGAQSAPHIPVDVQALGCDVFVCSGHKLYGPTGIGVLYGRYELLDRIPPWQTGGGTIEHVTFEATTFAPPPARFEAGTPPVAEAAGLMAAIEYLEGLDLEAVGVHERSLLDYATARLREIPGLRLVGTAPGKLGVISFMLGQIHPHDVATVLDTFGVAVRSGHHCAQPLMRALGLTATVRASLGLYNTCEDVDQLVEALLEARTRFTA